MTKHNRQHEKKRLRNLIYGLRFKQLKCKECGHKSSKLRCRVCGGRMV